MKKTIYITITLFLFTGCSKEWLAEKRDISLIVPSSLADMRLLMNNDIPLAHDGRIFAEVAGDDYYVLEDQLNAASFAYRNTYLWNDEVYSPEQQVVDWNTSYRQIFIANVVLEGLDKIVPKSATNIEYNDIKGAALFFRAKALFNLTEIYAKPYDPLTASTDLGIPLRLNADINVPIERSTIKTTWDKIITDLQDAVKLLRPQPTVITNTSRPTANALLARVYLCLQDYEKSLFHANKSLEVKNELLDYNTLNLSATYPLPRFNKEVIMHSEMAAYTSAFMTINSRTKRELYDAYDINDLRKQAFFRALPDGEFSFRGTYTGSAQVFSGFAVNEMYLIKAECLARLEEPEDAMEVLNSLLLKRYKQGFFTPINAINSEDALEIVLLERRKELLRRGLRWSDIRRLNKEPRFQTNFKRIWQGNTYTLSTEKISTYAAPFPYAAFSVK